MGLPFHDRNGRLVHCYKNFHYYVPILVHICVSDVFYGGWAGCGWRCVGRRVRAGGQMGEVADGRVGLG